MTLRVLRCGLLALAFMGLTVTVRADACENCATMCAAGKAASCSCCGGEVLTGASGLHEFVGNATLSPTSETIDVDVANFQFTDANITIDLGDTVRWTVSGGVHTVTSDTDAWVSSPALGLGDTFEVTFNLPGTYAYYCQFHGGPGGSGMSGTVTVIPEPRTAVLLLLGFAAAYLIGRTRIQFRRQ